MNTLIPCWCNNNSLSVFSNEYLVCDQCNTLVSQTGVDLNMGKNLVKDDETDFYGKNYWLQHQGDDLGLPNIFQRSRTDLSERCLYWLRALLKYRLPPASVLELGCAHGGFVKLLQTSGFTATGLELSPWVAEFARNRFDIKTIVGPIEEQKLASESFDIIALMDVLEHLPDPKKTISECLRLIKQDGILLVQTPNYQVGKTYEDMLAEQSSFLQLLKSDEHLFLFSKQAVIKFFQELSREPIYIEFEPAIFAEYDMFMIVSKSPIKTLSKDEIEKYLSTNCETQLIQILFDLYGRYEDATKELKVMNQMQSLIEKQANVLNKPLIRILRKLKIV